MERIQNDGQHDYLVTPPEYPVTSNEAHSTYDQFIQLRDTLIFSNKYYNGKAGLKLVIGETEETVEVLERNIFMQRFDNDWATGGYTVGGPLGTYVSTVPGDIISQYPTLGNLCCMINKDGHYRIVHKEEVKPTATQEKVYCYVDIYRKDSQGVYKIAIIGGVAVFDWQGAGTLSGSTSGTQPNGSCSVSFKLGQLFQKMTAFGYMERDLQKGDILVLRMKDAETDPNTGENLGNNLTLQDSSNFWSIEYLDLPYNI